MADMRAIKELLASEYGITSIEELREAMRKMPKLNIGAFVAPVKKNGDEKNV